MKKKVTLLLIIPSLFLFLALNTGYGQSDSSNEAETVVPLYYSYTYNMPLNCEQLLMLEYWMICEMPFDNSEVRCCCVLEDWMLNEDDAWVYDGEGLEDWMLYDMLDSEMRICEMEEWMFGFEPFVESALYKKDLSGEVEGWMLEFNFMAQQFIQEAFMSVKDWMFSNSYKEHDSALELEDWMIDGLSMN